MNDKDNNKDVIKYLSKKLRVNTNSLGIKNLKEPPTNSSGKISYSYLEVAWNTIIKFFG